MSISVRDAIRYVHTSRRDSGKANSVKDSDMLARRGSFETLLGHVAKTATMDPENTDALDPSTVQRLVEWIQLEMNTLLFDVVGMNSSNEGFWGRPTVSGQPFQGEYDGIHTKRAAAGANAPRPAEGTEDTDAIIRQASERYGVDPHLVQAVVRAESNFDPAVESTKGARGLMQLMPETAQELGVVDAYDPRENVMGGTRYLRRLLDRYEGNIPLALAAYNWGMGNVERNPGRLPEETRTYIARVNTFYRESVKEAG